MTSKWAHLEGLEIKQAFGEAMYALAKQDEKLTVVVSDYGRRLNLAAFRAELPEAFVQCGIAEQNQIEVAAGLANEGFHVVSPAYASFSTTRSLDQLRILLSTMEAPVCVVGLSAGFESGSLGSSHMALEDIATIRAIPHITCVCPANNEEMASYLEEFLENPRPTYMRLSGSLPDASIKAQEEIPALGRARVVARGKDDTIALLATGSLTLEALKARELLAREGVAVSVIEFPTVKPLDTDMLDELLHFDVVLTIEEHSVLGGFGSAVAEFYAGKRVSPELIRLGSHDHYPVADLPARLLAGEGLLKEGIAKTVREALKRS